MYLMLSTCLDMAFAVGYLGQFCTALTVRHWEFAKHVLHYIQGCINCRITLGMKNGLTRYSDADWAGNKENWKSTSESIFLLHDRAISWASKKQTSVALSTIEAEYIALSNASKEACWIKQLLKDLRQLQDKITIKTDSQGTIAFTKILEQHPKIKHIDIWYHFMWDLIEKRVIKLEYCSMADIVADILMKGLPWDAHEWHTKMIGLKG